MRKGNLTPYRQFIFMDDTKRGSSNRNSRLNNPLIQNPKSFDMDEQKETCLSCWLTPLELPAQSLSRLSELVRHLNTSHLPTCSIPWRKDTDQFPRANFMIWKSSVLWWNPGSLPEPGPEPNAISGEDVWVWLPQPTR